MTGLNLGQVNLLPTKLNTVVLNKRAVWVRSNSLLLRWWNKKLDQKKWRCGFFGFHDPVPRWRGLDKGEGLFYLMMALRALFCSDSSVTSSTLKMHSLTMSSRSQFFKAFSRALPVARLPSVFSHSLNITMACWPSLSGGFVIKWPHWRNSILNSFTIDRAMESSDGLPNLL